MFLSALSDKTAQQQSDHRNDVTMVALSSNLRPPLPGRLVPYRPPLLHCHQQRDGPRSFPVRSNRYSLQPNRRTGNRRPLSVWSGHTPSRFCISSTLRASGPPHAARMITIIVWRTVRRAQSPAWGIFGRWGLSVKIPSGFVGGVGSIRKAQEFAGPLFCWQSSLGSHRTDGYEGQQ